MQLCKESVLGSVVVVAAMSLVTAASGEVITWTGLGDDDKWGTAENWSSDPFLPDADDDVYIPAFSTDGIQMDLGSPSEPEIIASLTVSVSAGGSLTIQADKGLQINGDFHVNVGSGACSWDLTMEEHSRLDLVDQDGNADLIHINVTMEPVTSGTPSELRVDGAIEQGDFEVNEGCIVTVGTGTAPERN